MNQKKEKAIRKDVNILSKFFQVYCSHQHTNKNGNRVTSRGILKKYLEKELWLCDSCQQHFFYAAVKRILCPYFPKPACKKCPSICYSDSHRQFMREMMKFSGKYLISRGRIDLIFKYFF